MPGGQVARQIPAHQDDQGCSWILFSQDLQGIGCIVRSGAVHLNPGELKFPVIHDHEVEHVQADFHWCDRLVQFVGGNGR